jgi:hypothetical protein
MLFGFRLFKGSEVGVEILQLEKDGTVTIMRWGQDYLSYSRRTNLYRVVLKALVLSRFFSVCEILYRGYRARKIRSFNE